MNQYHTIKAVGYGLFLWLIITGLIGAVYGFGLYLDMVESPWIGIFAALMTGGIALIFAKEANTATIEQAIAYSVLWLVIPISIDLLVIARLTDIVFTSWQYWLGHALVFASPWLIFWNSKRKGVL